MDIKYKQIETFMNQKNIALIGVSRNSKDYTRGLLREFKKNHYNTIPVNPNADEIENEKCYSNIDEIPLQLDAVIMLTPSVTAVNSVYDGIKKGVKNIWIYNGNEKDETFRALIEHCRKSNINVIYGHCPLMFLPGTAFPHRVHGFVTKLIGKYPR